jgi:single-strand DNA-binding protein
MGFVNKVMLMGNATRDPLLRQLPSGTQVCDFGIATNRVYRTATGEEREETAFVDCTAFGRVAEIVAQYAPKGRQLFIEGRLHFETWDDKEGARRSKLSVIAENVQLIGARAAREGEQAELPLNAKEQSAAPSVRATREVVVTAGPMNRTPKKNGKWRTREEPKAEAGAEVAVSIEDVDLPF